MDISSAGFTGEDSAATARYAVGRLRYAEAHARSLGWADTSRDARTGVLVWIRPALIRAETLDVEQYGRQHRRFPHQSTTDQWFDEAQFESYWKLGELTALQVLDGSAQWIPKEHLAALVRPAAALTGADVAAIFSGFLPRSGSEHLPEPSREPRSR